MDTASTNPVDPTEAQIDINETYGELLGKIIAQAYLQSGSKIEVTDSKQSLRTELKHILCLAYELGCSEKWMRKTVKRIINELKLEQDWDGKKSPLLNEP